MPKTPDRWHKKLFDLLRAAEQTGTALKPMLYTPKRRSHTMHRRHRESEDKHNPPRGPELGSDETRLMQEFGIQFDGLRYVYRCYRYECLSDAVSYAKLMRLKPECTQSSIPRHGATVSPSPSTQDLQRMASLNIRYDNGLYRFGSYRYERMQDAEAYARLCQKRGWR